MDQQMDFISNVDVMSIFPTPIVKTNIGRDFTKDELQLFFEDISMWKDEKLGMQNHRSKDYYLFDSHVDILGDIKKFCESQLKDYLEEIEGVDTDLAGLRITQSWLNKTKLGEYHNPHHHPNSYLSGVLYISCLPDDHINFNNRSDGLYNSLEFLMGKPTIWNAKSMSQNVIEGDFIMFPSWMSHHVIINEIKNRERISLSFNTFPIGEMGDEYNATHLKL